ncbi:MAG: ribosomal protein S18-alanine N-acetyltransferase [Endomicrobiales bacterium]|nr:ribosomal protein S18-alanine N-acetyltransferase [Endomicrobiales bacterium]
MPELKFLPFGKEHIPEVLSIENLSFPEPWSREMFEREISLPISRFFIAKTDYRIVGYTGYWKILNEAHLTNLAIHPEYRGMGLGRKLLAYVINNVTQQDIEKILLEVRESNEAAKRLYISMGFNVTGLRPKYYGTENAVLMEKNIKDFKSNSKQTANPDCQLSKT